MKHSAGQNLASPWGRNSVNFQSKAHKLRRPRAWKCCSPGLIRSTVWIVRACYLACSRRLIKTNLTSVIACVAEKGHLRCYHNHRIQHQQQQMVAEIWHNEASPPRTDYSLVFARWRQYAHPSNAPVFGPTRVCLPIVISIGSVSLAGLTDVPNTQTHTHRPRSLQHY